MASQYQPGQSVGIASVPNMRDLGGWPTRGGGRIRRGVVYRSTDLADLAGADMDAFEALGIRSVYDLRTEAERTSAPDRLPSSTEHVVVDILAGSPKAAPAQLFSVMTDPAAAQEMLGDGRGLALFELGYREIVSLPSAATGYRRLFGDLVSERHHAALFHCTTGKDRTGWASAALLMLLGVSDELVMQEYLLTNEELLPAEQPALDHFKALGGDPALLRPCVAVEPEYLQAALDEMNKRFGTIEEYFTKALGLDAAMQDKLRSTLIETA